MDKVNQTSSKPALSDDDVDLYEITDTQFDEWLELFKSSKLDQLNAEFGRAVFD